MKKALKATLAVLAAFALVACGSDEEETEINGNGNDTTTIVIPGDDPEPADTTTSMEGSLSGEADTEQPY